MVWKPVVWQTQWCNPFCKVLIFSVQNFQLKIWILHFHKNLAHESNCGAIWNFTPKMTSSRSYSHNFIHIAHSTFCTDLTAVLRPPRKSENRSFLNLMVLALSCFASQLFRYCSALPHMSPLITLILHNNYVPALLRSVTPFIGLVRRFGDTREIYSADYTDPIYMYSLIRAFIARNGF